MKGVVVVVVIRRNVAIISKRGKESSRHGSSWDLVIDSDLQLVTMTVCTLSLNDIVLLSLNDIVLKQVGIVLN